MAWQRDLARTNDPHLMTPAAVQRSAAAANLGSGRRAIRNFVADNPPETRSQGFNALDIGTEIRDAYMDQRGSGLPFVNKGMNISDFLKSQQAADIASQYGNVLDPRQAYHQWIRSKTAPGTVDRRNQYQLEMNQLRDEYPEAYATEFPEANLMMKGLPGVAKLAASRFGNMGSMASGIFSAMKGLKDMNLGMSNPFMPLGEMLGVTSFDEDEDEWRWKWPWQEKAQGGIMNLKNYMHGGSHAPPRYSRPSIPSRPTSMGQSLHGGRQYDNPGYVAPNYNYTIGYGDQQVDPALAAAAGLGPAAGGFGGTTVGWGEGVDGGDTTARTPSGDGGGYEPPLNYAGRQYSGAPLQDEDDTMSTLGSSELREQAEKQFDTQFMAAQLLHDRSRGKFDQGGLADMSENTLEGFDMAKSKWKWKYDEQIRGLMGKGFSLKEAIDEMWNKYQMMPYKGFSMEVT